MTPMARRTMSGPLDDATLLAQVGNGNVAALGMAYDRWQGDVYAVLVRVRASRWGVDDLVQETFLALPAAAPNYTEGRSARSFVIGVALQMVRRERRRVARRIQLWRTHGEGLLDDTASDDPERDTATRQTLQRVERALAKLPAPQREAVVLVELEGMSGEEAAEALEVPVGTVWTRLHYARAALREAVGQEARR